MPPRFVASPTARREVDALMQVEVDRFRDDVIRRARRAFRSDFGLGDTTRTVNSIQDYGPGGLILVIGAGDHKGPQMTSADIGLILHQGHRAFGPRGSKPMVFRPKGSKFVVYARKIRAVGESPFLTSALIGAARGGTVQWAVRNIKTGVKAPGPHRL